MFYLYAFLTCSKLILIIVHTWLLASLDLIYYIKLKFKIKNLSFYAY